jgi:hypothetical protein
VPDEMHIESFIPQPMWDGRRVALTLHVSGLPAYGPGSHFLNFIDMPNDEAETEQPGAADRRAEVVPSPPSAASEESKPASQERPPSPYPDVTLGILDPDGNLIATTYIVEHKEPDLEFTLHVPAIEPGTTYVARAEMTMNDEIIQVAEVPFEFVPQAPENTQS